MNGHAFGNTENVIDLGSGHFLRPIHELVRRDEPIGKPVRPRPDSSVVGFMLWHDCSSEADSWRIVPMGSALVIECGICGDRGNIINGEWVKT